MTLTSSPFVGARCHDIWFIVLFAVVVALSTPRPGAAQARETAEEQQVLAVEDEYIAAEVSRDEAALRRLVDDRFVLNSSDGSTSGKEELIDAVLSMKMVGQTTRERTVLIEGNIAVIFGTADIRFATAEGTEKVSALRYTSTYVNRDGQWRMLALHMQQRFPD